MEAKRFGWVKTAAITAAVVVVVLFVGSNVLKSSSAAISAGSSDGYSSKGLEMAPAASSAPGFSLPDRGGAADIGYSGEAAVSPEPSPGNGGTATAQDHGEKIVKTGSLTIKHADPSRAVADLKARAAKFDAFTDDESFTAGEAPSGYVVFRVASPKYEDFVAAMKKGYDVEAAAVQKSDMTKVYTDTKAKLSSNSKELAAVEKLLERAKSVQDVLAIRQQTEQLRSENEQLRSSLSQIDDQASWSTLTVQVQSPAAIKGEDYWGRNTVQSLVTAFQASFRSMAVLVVALIPWLLAGLLAWGLFRLFRRLFGGRRHLSDRAEPPASS